MQHDHELLLTHRCHWLLVLSSGIIICIQLEPVEYLKVLLTSVWSKVQLQDRHTQADEFW